MPVTPPNVVHIPPYVAKELGFFAENNIDVEFVTFEGGTQTLRGSVAGGLDITGTSSDPAIIAAAKGAGTKVLGSYSHRLSQSMLVQGDIKSCKDLKDRKIGIQEVGAFNEVMSRAVLATCGLTPKDVQYIPVSTKGRVPGLLTNQIDTAILHVDQAIVAKKKKPELNILVNLWEPLPKWLYAAYIAPEKEIASNRQLYIDIMAALIKANRYIYNNKAKVVEIATKYTQQDGDAVAQTYDILANAGRLAGERRLAKGYGRVDGQQASRIRHDQSSMINRATKNSSTFRSSRLRWQKPAAVCKATNVGIS